MSYVPLAKDSFPNLRRYWYPRRDMRWALCGAAALLVASALLGCDRVRCEDRGEAAIQVVLPHLSQEVVSNLVGEASLSIADSLTDPAVQFYTPTVEKAPVAQSLTVVPPSDFSIGMGATIIVRTRGTSAPYMAVRVPVQFGSGLCLWGVYVCVKPGGGFAKDNPDWVTAEGGTNAAPVVKLTDEVLLYAQQRRFQ